MASSTLITSLLPGTLKIRSTNRTMANQDGLHHFQWTQHNHFTFIDDGDGFYRDVIQAIDQAHHWVAIEMYLVKSGTVMSQLVESLCHAAKRGVTVQLLFDALGSKGLSHRDTVQLRAADCQLHLFNPPRTGSLSRLNWFHRDHRKLILIDQHIAFVGGAGLADEFSPQLQNNQHWDDFMVMIYGPCVHQWQTLFRAAWPAAPAPEPPTTQRMPPTHGEKGRVSYSEGLRTSSMHVTLTQRIHNAEHTLWMVTPYFHPSLKMRRALIQAAKRQVDVRIIVPGKHIDHSTVRALTIWHYPKLLKAGVKIYEYQPRFIHAKGLLVDHWVSVGSCNMDRWTDQWNREANQEIEGEESLNNYRARFQQRFFLKKNHFISQLFEQIRHNN